MVLYSLQLFVCPVNDNMTHVPASRAMEMETSDISMTRTIFRRHDASDCGDDHRCNSPSPRGTFVRPASASMRPELCHVVDPSCETFKGISQILIIVEVHLS
jgi:hypothetical protein